MHKVFKEATAAWLPASGELDAMSLLVTLAPLLAPLFFVAILSLGSSTWRVLRPRAGSTIATLLGPLVARGALRALRRALPRAAAGGSSTHSGEGRGLRRSLSSTLNLRDAAAVESAFTSAVHDAVSVPDLRQFRARMSGMPAKLPAAEPHGSGDWTPMLQKDTSVMTYRAWRHCLPSGTAEYLSVTVFEGATPQDLLEFFNDDAHRMHWDDLLAGYEVLEVDPRTGAEVVRWVRKFPLMCSPRDYVFCRRSWVEGDEYFTVTRSCTHDACPPRPRCRRVDDFYSSWRMRAVPGRDGGVATEVVLQHFEEMHIQHDLAKLAVRRGMWGCVQNMERGLCAFIKQRRERQRARVMQRRVSSGAPPSPRRTPAGLPRSGAADLPRPTLLGLLLRTGLMAVGGITVARHAAGAGPQLAGAVGAALLRGQARRRGGRE